MVSSERPDREQNWPRGSSYPCGRQPTKPHVKSQKEKRWLSPICSVAQRTQKYKVNLLGPLLKMDQTWETKRSKGRLWASEYGLAWDPLGQVQAGKEQKQKRHRWRSGSPKYSCAKFLRPGGSFFSKQKLRGSGGSPEGLPQPEGDKVAFKPSFLFLKQEETVSIPGPPASLGNSSSLRKPTWAAFFFAQIRQITLKQMGWVRKFLMRSEK